jgi:hypothetical protein
MTRDVLQREKTLALVRRCWADFPTMRLGQLLHYLASKSANNADSFYVEDKALNEAMEKVIKDPQDDSA